MDPGDGKRFSMDSRGVL